MAPPRPDRAPATRLPPGVPAPSFRPGWWIPGANAQTVYGKFVRRPLRAPTRTERWETPDDDFLDVVRLDPRGDWAGRADAPRLLLLHGLEGGLQSHYVHGLFTECALLGWGMDLMLHRTCGPELNRARRFYHSGETSDAALFVARVAAEHPAAPLALCGVSLGGNQLVKYLGEAGAGEGPAVPGGVRAAVAISVPYDLARGSRRIGQGFSRVYERHFLRSLSAKARRKLAVYPDLFDPARLDGLRTLWGLDDLITGPLHGFRDAADYYERSSARRFLATVRVPTLLLSAADDPFLPGDVLDEVRAAAARNPCLTPEFHPRGGHVGFVGGWVPWRADYYAERRTLEWARAHLPAPAPAPATGRTGDA
jgi:predicted alpha/beta-fold hydrolase